MGYTHTHTQRQMNISAEWNQTCDAFGWIFNWDSCLFKHFIEILFADLIFSTSPNWETELMHSHRDAFIVWLRSLKASYTFQTSPWISWTLVTKSQQADFPASCIRRERMIIVWLSSGDFSPSWWWTKAGFSFFGWGSVVFANQSVLAALFHLSWKSTDSQPLNSNCYIKKYYTCPALHSDICVCT